jgi:glycosyltransferase involved in cell wall biosynthesis
MTTPLHLAINPVSFGQVSTCLLRELYNREEDISLTTLPAHGQIDLSTQEEDADFSAWLQKSMANFGTHHRRTNRIFKLWHLQGSLESFSNEQVLFSFYELDQPTAEEINIVKNNHAVLFSSELSVQVFRNLGCDNVHYVPLCFDGFNFAATKKEYHSDDRIVFNIVGKFEKRKHHVKAVQAWIKKYGDKKEYALQCALWNPFLSGDQNSSVIAGLLGGKQPFNVTFMGFMQKNSQYNDFLNSADVVLGVSGGEGWGLPEFHSVAMGKHAVVLDCSGYKGWANSENAVLLNPSGKIPAYDNMFFRQGAPYNQGSIFDFDEEDFIGACEKSIERVKKNRVNEEGMKLKKKFTSARTLDAILDHMK